MSTSSRLALKRFSFGKPAPTTTPENDDSISERTVIVTKPKPSVIKRSFEVMRNFTQENQKEKARLERQKDFQAMLIERTDIKHKLREEKHKFALMEKKIEILKSHLDRKLKEQERATSTMNMKVWRLEFDNNQLDLEIQGMKVKIERLEKALEKEKEKCARIAKESEQEEFLLKAQLAIQQTAKEELQGEVQRLVTVTSAVQDQVADLVRDNSELKWEKGQAEKEVEGQKEHIRALIQYSKEVTMGKTAKEIEALVKEKDELRVEKSAAVTQAAKAGCDAMMIQDELRQHEQTIVSLKAARKTLLAEIGDLKQILDAEKSVSAAAADSEKTTLCALWDKQEELKAATRANKKLGEEAAEDHNILTATCHALRRVRDALHTELTTARQLAEATNELCRRQKAQAYSLSVQNSDMVSENAVLKDQLSVEMATSVREQKCNKIAKGVIDQLRSELKNAEAEGVLALTALVAAQTANHTLEGILGEVQNAHKTTTTKMQHDFELANKKRNKNIATLESQLRGAKDEYEAKLAEKQELLSKTEESLNIADSVLIDLDKQVKDVKSELEHMRIHADKSWNENIGLVAENTKLQEQSEKVTQDFEAADKKLAAFEIEVVQAWKYAEELKAELSDAKAAHTITKKKLHKAEKQLKASEQAFDTRGQIIEKLETICESLKFDKQELQDRLVEAKRLWYEAHNSEADEEVHERVSWALHNLLTTSAEEIGKQQDVKGLEAGGVNENTLEDAHDEEDKENMLPPMVDESF